MPAAAAIGIFKSIPRVAWIAVAVLAVVLVIFFVGKSYGNTRPGKTLDLDSVPDHNRPRFNPGPYTDALYEDIYAGPFTARNTAAYKRANDDLSDTELAAVYNDWQKRYFKKDQQTLIRAIEGEEFSWIDYTFWQAKDRLINRLRKIENLGLVS